MTVVMPDVQNYFIKALAVSNIYTSEDFGELYGVISFSSRAINVCGSYGHLNFFPYKLSLNKKREGAPLVLHRFIRYKYLREDHSMGQTVV